MGKWRWGFRSHIKLNYLRPMYFTVYINFIMFSLQQEKPNDTLLSLYIFLNAMHLNLNAKGQFWLTWATDFSPTLLCFSIRTFQNFSQTVGLVHAQKKRTTTQFVIWQAINIKFGNEKNDEKVTSSQDHVSYGRNPKPL